MVDFRKMIPVLAVLAFMLGSAVHVNAQPTTLTCFTSGGTNTPNRAEGLTELEGDFQVTCSGGVPTAPGVAIPQVNIQVFLNTNITSRLMDTVTPYPHSEAVLLLDEPAPGAQFGCNNPTSCVAYGNGLGTGNAPSTVGYYGSGTIGATVAGCAFANGTCSGNNRNVFQGIQTAPNSITFLGVPIDPPGTNGSRFIRITNIRGNANALGVAGSSATPTSVIETITATPFNFLPVNGNASQTVGSVQRGLAFSVVNSAGNAITVNNFQQCVSRTSGANALGFLRYTELFGTAFKRRNIITGSGLGGSVTGGTSNGSAEQNIVSGGGAGTYNTESGFTTATVTPQLPASGAGFSAIGQADQGTRLKAVFNNVPNGVNLFVDTTATSNTFTPPVAGFITGAAGTTNAFDRAILTASEVGAFSAVGATSGAPTGTGGAGTAQLTVSNNTAVAVWEVLDSQASSFAVFNFGVWATYTAAPATNTPALATGTVNGSYAPISTLTTAQTSSAPIPRFADTSTATTLFTVVPCVTNLLFPYITTAFGFDTGIAISSTSTDPFGTAAQSGTCTLNWYGTAFTGATPTPTVNSGTTWTGLGSQILNNVTGGFTGYMIAVCRFQYAHGFAFVSDLGARNLAMGYLALIIPDPARSPVPFPCANSGIVGCVSSGEQLGY